MKQVLGFLSTVVLLCSLAHATIPVEAIKGLDLTQPGYEDLNPLNGMPWADGILENHGEIVAVDDPLRELIQLLFHRTGTFDPSTLPNTTSSVPYLSPHVIGEIVGSLKSGRPYIPQLPGGTKFQKARNHYNRVNKLLGQLTHDPRTYRVLLALLWFKAHNKHDFSLYYDGVRAYLPSAVKVTPDGWEESKYPKNEFVPVDAPLPEHYDDFLHWIARRTLDAPPLEHQQTSISLFGSFADCGETSLKNFLKMILDENGTYNVRVLEFLHAKREVIRFFEKFRNREAQAKEQDKDNLGNRDDYARNVWGDTSSNQANVKYQNSGPEGNYELSAGASNMFALIKDLIPGLKNAADWPDMGRMIEEARRANGLGSFDFEKVDLTNDFGEITFRVEKLGGFKWYFQAAHFYVDALPAESLGTYPRRELSDAAIYFPVETLPRNDPRWPLYAHLRQNEDIEKVVTSLVESGGLSLDIAVPLLNRLSTSDAKKRVFAKVAESLDVKQLRARRDFKPTSEYLSALMSAGNFEAAKVLLQLSPWYNDEIVRSFLGHEYGADSAVFSKDGTKVISGGSKAVITWDVASAKPRYNLRVGGWEDFHFFGKLGKVALSPNEDRIATYGTSITPHGVVYIWDLKSAQLITTLKVHDFPVAAVEFSPDGKRVLTSSFDGTARVWDAESAQQLQIFGTPGNIFSGTANPLYNAVWNKDGGKILTSAKTAKIWDVARGDVVKEFQAGSDLKSAVWSRDEAKILAVEAHRVVVLDADSGQNLQDIETPAGEFKLGSFSHNEDMVVTASDDNAVRVWDVKTRAQLKKFQHTARVMSASFSPDGKMIVTSSEDGVVRIWKLDLVASTVPES